MNNPTVSPTNMAQLVVALSYAPVYDCTELQDWSAVCAELKAYRHAAMSSVWIFPDHSAVTLIGPDRLPAEYLGGVLPVL